jgi:hypothetical protein
MPISGGQGTQVSTLINPQQATRRRKMMNFSLLFFIVAGYISAVISDSALPMLNMDGFAWAENLAFDGINGLFVSEAVRGQILRISYDIQAKNYTMDVHVSKGFKQIGGLSVTPDGQTLYAGAVFEDKTFGIIATPTKASKVGEQDYTIIARDMDHLCNGMMLVPSDNALYGTSESGTLTRVDIATGEKRDVSTTLVKPDGLWYDEKTNYLFIGELVTKKMRIFDVTTQTMLADYFPAASSFGTIHLIDDLAVVGDVDINNLGQSKVVAADWTGKQVIEFTLDGTWSQVITPPEGITFFEPTSVRRGKGFGFDPNSYYITEGGGIDRKYTNRRVLQLTPGSV